MPASPGTVKGGNSAADPFLNFNFMIEISGVIEGGFHECSGLESTIDVIEHREGGQNTTLKKIPGQTKFANLVLKRGMYEDLKIYDWHKAAVEGPPDRKDGSVIQYDRQGTEVARWNFFRAWPVKYTGPTFSAEGNDVAIETLEIAHEGLERVK
jgi:phage tail-like protein